MLVRHDDAGIGSTMEPLVFPFVHISGGPNSTGHSSRFFVCECPARYTLWRVAAVGVADVRNDTSRRTKLPGHSLRFFTCECPTGYILWRVAAVGVEPTFGMTPLSGPNCPDTRYDFLPASVRRAAALRPDAVVGLSEVRTNSGSLSKSGNAISVKIARAS
jgi:hypothetical protein